VVCVDRISGRILRRAVAQADLDAQPIRSRQQSHQLVIIGKGALAELDARDVFVGQFLNLRL
jgi:hypothetical protein